VAAWPHRGHLDLTADGAIKREGPQADTPLGRVLPGARLRKAEIPGYRDWLD